MSTPTCEPVRTLTGVTAERAEALVDDCELRMLEPHEQAAGMAFPRSMQWRGTKREKSRMAGNAVTPPSSRDLIACGIESLGAT